MNSCLMFGVYETPLVNSIIGIGVLKAHCKHMSHGKFASFGKLDGNTKFF